MKGTTGGTSAPPQDGTPASYLASGPARWIAEIHALVLPLHLRASMRPSPLRAFLAALIAASASVACNDNTSPCGQSYTVPLSSLVTDDGGALASDGGSLTTDAGPP